MSINRRAAELIESTVAFTILPDPLVPKKIGWFVRGAMNDQLPQFAPLHPFMVDKTEAARLCGLGVTTYDKYAKRGLLPPLNVVGKITVEALRRACLKLDGITALEANDDPAERALREWAQS